MTNLTLIFYQIPPCERAETEKSVKLKRDFSKILILIPTKINTKDLICIQKLLPTQSELISVYFKMR